MRSRMMRRRALMVGKVVSLRTAFSGARQAVVQIPVRINGEANDLTMPVALVEGMALDDEVTVEVAYEDARAPDEERTYVTKSGTVLRESDLHRMVDGANEDYCTEIVQNNEGRSRCFQPMPCPDHSGPEFHTSQEEDRSL
jgi:hypothetical protein